MTLKGLYQLRYNYYSKEITLSSLLVMEIELLASPKQTSWHVCLATAAKTFCCGRFPRSEKGGGGKAGGTD
jgi:hypothetical protein